MAFISLESSNKDFSYIIHKDPTSSEKCIVKSIRKGYGFGWFAPDNPQKYCLRFLDPPQEMSYSNKDFEYLDVSALSSPAAYSNLINTFFGSALKAKSSLDTGGDSKTVMTLGFIQCHRRSLEHFTQHFSGISQEEYCVNKYRVRIEGDSVYQVIHLGSLLCLFMMMRNQEIYVDVNESVIIKYLNSIKAIKCPYYIANLFKVQFLNTKAFFNKFSSELSGACVEGVKFEFGNTLQARRNWIESHLKLRKNIVDVGAGLEFNMSGLSHNIKGYYYPIDRDEEVRQAVNKKIEHKKFENVAECLKDWSDVIELLERDTEVIVSEVLEHNELEEGLELVNNILEHPFVKRVLITLPLKEFNKHYLIPSGEFRHDDHKWELTPVIRDKIEGLLKVLSVSFEWFPIGDVVGVSGEEVSPSVGLVIEKSN